MELYSDGTAYIDLLGSTRETYWHTSHLSKALECHEDSGICEDNRVYFNGSHGNRGIVLEVYANGLAHLDVLNSPARPFRHVSELSREVSCDEDTGICVGSEVAFDWEQTGTVLEVFSNGMVYIDIKDFSGHRYRHVSELSKLR